MKLEVGDRIKYVSAAGVLTGIVNKIILSENAAGETIPWIDIAYMEGQCSKVRMCASDAYLKQMKVEVLS